VLVIEAYNEAGEKVKILARTGISADIDEVFLMTGGNEVSFFNPIDGALTISIPGVDSAEQAGGLYFKWDGKSENMGLVGQGDYYIKISVIDNYGHVNTRVKQVKLIKTEEYVRVNIYNTAGELIYRAVKNTAVSGAAVLDMEDAVYIGGGAAPVMIKYTPSDYFEWDGKNMLGRLVDGGVYQLVLEAKNRDGYYAAQTSMAFTVLNLESAPSLDGLKSYPNPCETGYDGNKRVKIDWPVKQPGEINVSIYNTAGELVKKLEGSLASAAGIVWDCTALKGGAASSGLYVAVVRAVKEDGSGEVKILKIVIINRFDAENNAVN
jgi:flagellar hook assembly protein FlgD